MRNQKLVVTDPETYLSITGADGVTGLQSSYSDEKGKGWVNRKNEAGIKAIESTNVPFNLGLAQSAFGPAVRQLPRIDPSAVVETLDEGDEIFLAAKNATSGKPQHLRFMVTNIAFRTITAQPSERRMTLLHAQSAKVAGAPRA